MAAEAGLSGNRALNKLAFGIGNGTDIGAIAANDRTPIYDTSATLVGFTTPDRIPTNGTVAATGTNLATAAQLSSGFSVVTGADGTVGVKLPATPTAGTTVWIKGTTAGVLKVYPDAAATINAIGSNGAISLASGVIPAIFVAASATQWYTFPLLPS